MSDEETITMDSSDTQLLTAEYKDGQLQIVEVTPFERDKMESILPDVINSDGEQQKYMQVLDPSKGLVQLDLLNLTLVRCDDGEESYRLVTNSESDSGDMSADTVTCVLQSSDGEEQDNGESYVMVDGDQGPLVFLRSTEDQRDRTTINIKQEPKPRLCTSKPGPVVANKSKTKILSPNELLDKVKAMQKAKALITTQTVRVGKRGRRRAGELPSPAELLTSPNFKLYLYSCKLCSFKCNAVKELAAHRNREHSSGSRQYKSGGGSAGGRGSYITLQCARCPYRGGTHSQLLKHIQTKHLDEPENAISLDSKEVEEADVLVCGACGFESSARNVFREHIQTEHGATTV